MPQVATPPRGAQRRDPASLRGLRRQRTRGPLPVLAPTAMPAAVEPMHLLALLTRVRRARVDCGELSVRRLYDVRAFKCAYAELGYLRRLAAGGRVGGRW